MLNKTTYIQEGNRLLRDTSKYIELSRVELDTWITTTIATKNKILRNLAKGGYNCCCRLSHHWCQSRLHKGANH